MHMLVVSLCFASVARCVAYSSVFSFPPPYGYLFTRTLRSVLGVLKGGGWVWQMGLMVGLKLWQVWGCSTYLGLGLVAPIPRSAWSPKLHVRHKLALNVKCHGQIANLTPY